MGSFLFHYHLLGFLNRALEAQRQGGMAKRSKPKPREQELLDTIAEPRDFIARLDAKIVHLEQRNAELESPN